MIKNILILILLLVMIFTERICVSQVTASDYSRADNLVKITSGKVFYDSVKPEWIGKSGIFYYENTTPRGIEYILVDPLNRTKRHAFDQKRFAAVLKG